MKLFYRHYKDNTLDLFPMSAVLTTEEAIKMAEKGILPKKDFALVNKIENYLGIVIKEKSAREKSFDEDCK